MFRWESPLFFANAAAFRRQLRQLARDRDPSWIVLQCEAITDIDVTAAGMLEELDNELNDRGVHLAFAEMRDHLQELTLRYGLFETLDRDHFYPTPRRGPRGDRGDQSRRLPRRASIAPRTPRPFFRDGRGMTPDDPPVAAGRQARVLARSRR